jgi:hypothetical protein
MERPEPLKRQNGTASGGQLRNRRSIGQIGLCERGARTAVRLNWQQYR